jgi:DNA-binding MarR family transcriptional regulator
MTQDPNVNDVAGALYVSVGLLRRRLSQLQTDSELTLSEISTLSRLDRGVPTTSSVLAQVEQISPQSMGATLGALEARGLIARRADPADGRRGVLSLTEAGQEMLRKRRNARTEQLANALSRGFTSSELEQLNAAAPLIERLAQSI